VVKSAVTGLELSGLAVEDGTKGLSEFSVSSVVPVFWAAHFLGSLIQILGDWDTFFLSSEVFSCQPISGAEQY